MKRGLIVLWLEIGLNNGLALVYGYSLWLGGHLRILLGHLVVNARLKDQPAFSALVKGLLEIWVWVGGYSVVRTRVKSFPVVRGRVASSIHILVQQSSSD